MTAAGSTVMSGVPSATLESVSLSLCRYQRHSSSVGSRPWCCHAFGARRFRHPWLRAKYVAPSSEMAASGGSRSDVLGRVGQHLAIDPSALAAALFADLPGERIVLSPEAIPNPTDAIRRINLTMAQAMLFRATSVRVRAEGGVRPIVRLAKLRGLISMISSRR
jgi:predicted nuclease of restriction endonuclease-like RecB superfamily